MTASIAHDLLVLTQYLVFGIGVASILFSAYMALQFFRLKVPFGRALAFMCFGEFLAGICTLIFSLASVVKTYGSLGPWEMICLRLVIFGAISISTLHMYAVVRKTINGPR